MGGSAQGVGRLASMFWSRAFDGRVAKQGDLASSICLFCLWWYARQG